jgi:5-(carboxyamino)imidazole ribonucleotide mutase
MVEVGIILGSISDKEIGKKCSETLEKLGIKYKITVASAHRTPERVKSIVKEYEKKGVKVFIGIAGLAAALPGVIASLTAKPVIGVPTDAALGGLDALLSMSQMPPGIPVACVGINNGKNAALLAAEIISVGDKKVEEKIKKYRNKLAKDTESSARMLEKV